eukprot:NODE_175_length_15885_cov_0.420563.p5 type:complete len:277 gc:universal NODE_175_length_15885_cov_0.420563:11565-12395(+)
MVTKMILLTLINANIAQQGQGNLNTQNPADSEWCGDLDPKVKSFITASAKITDRQFIQIASDILKYHEDAVALANKHPKSNPFLNTDILTEQHSNPIPQPANPSRGNRRILNLAALSLFAGNQNLGMRNLLPAKIDWNAQNRGVQLGHIGHPLEETADPNSEVPGLPNNSGIIPTAQPWEVLAAIIEGMSESKRAVKYWLDYIQSKDVPNDVDAAFGGWASCCMRQITNVANEILHNLDEGVCKSVGTAANQWRHFSDDDVPTVTTCASLLKNFVS